MADIFSFPATSRYLCRTRCLSLPCYLNQLILQPQLFGALAAFSWIQCLHYGQKRSTTVCAIIFLLYLAIFAGFETGMTYAVRVSDPSLPFRLVCPSVTVLHLAPTSSWQVVLWSMEPNSSAKQYDAPFLCDVSIRSITDSLLTVRKP